MLDRERRYYDAHASEWVRTYPGRFVVVKDEALIGAFDTQDEALAAGATRFGLSSFLVRKVGVGQETVTIPALALGLIRADP